MSRKTAKADVIPVRQANQYNCMTTSLAMALRALGVPEDECSPQQVNKVVGAMPLRGAAWEPLLAAANHYGMRATLTLPSTVRQLKQWTDAGTPVVIAWNPEGREWSHASLVFDVDDDLNVYVADPNIPDPDETVRVVPKAEFYGKWYEKAAQGFLIRRPACAIDREITPDGRQVMASRTAFNKYNAPELITQLISVLGKEGLDDAVNQIRMKKIPQLIDKAWRDRRREASMRGHEHKTKWQDTRAATERVVEAFLQLEAKRPTEVRETKDKNAPIKGTLPRSKKNPAAEAAGQKKQTRGHRRKERGYNKARNPRKHTKHKRPLHASAAHVATMHLLARQTNELIRMKYKNLGDFGGTDPVVDSWFLEVAGPYEAMQGLMPILKKYKFRWKPASKSWSIHATKYAYNNRKRENFWNAARRNQEAAYPILQKKIDEINTALRAEEATPTPTRKELLREIQQGERISDRLKRLGIRVEYEYPNRYSVDEAKVWLFDTPFDLNPILKKHGFRWGSGRLGKGWWIAMREYTAILKPLVADIFRAMPVPEESEPSGGTAVFSDMSPRELSRWLDPVVSRDMEFNEGYDGEVSDAELKRGYMKELPRMKPHEQDQAMQNWLGGGLPSVNQRSNRR